MDLIPGLIEEIEKRVGKTVLFQQVLSKMLLAAGALGE